jgi:hypothetical protein
MNLTATTSVGNALIRTYGHGTDLPMSVNEAVSQGWVAKTVCDKNLGILYGHDDKSPSEEHPLGLYFTASGGLAGAQVTIYGSNKEVGNAAPDALVEKGFWVADAADKQWHMDVSFRSSSEMCGAESSSELLGDRLVINQGTLDYSVPLVAGEAREGSWTEGSCFNKMGQHHFYDFNSAPEMSWDPTALLPLVAMYNPPFDASGTLNAFFFTTPVTQPGSSLWNLASGKADWESPALTPKLMCKNWCDDDCTWESSWSTMHLFTQKDYNDLECPGVSRFDPIGISCSGVSKH